ncbi:MAG TPA: adenosylcobinamide-GDP ribazoletransferase [Atribacterota bacterium]|nr:adenosylcobinamide-GDP ribazoletransferase [Atribacterota bacterium]
MSNITRFVRRFLLALSFLTVLPIPLIFFKKEIENNNSVNADFSKSSVFFPLVGLIIGGILHIFCLLLKYIELPVHLQAGLLLTIWVFLSGGLHLEGLADMVDGFSGGKNKEEIIAIMKDGSIGAKGAIVLILLIMLKYLLLLSLAEHAKWVILLLAPMLGRWSMIIAAYSGKPASSSNTLSNMFTRYLGKKELLISTLFVVMVMVSLLMFSGQLIFEPLILLLINIGMTVIMVTYSKQKIGGICGDVIGAANEINELAVLLVSFLIIN